jgi:uncharacterized protein YkwD
MNAKNLIVIISSVVFLIFVFLAFQAKNKSGDNKFPTIYSEKSINQDLNEAYIGELFTVINKFRKDANLPELTEDPVLMEVANERANEMFSLNSLTLKRPDGSDWSTLLLSAGISGSVAGENHSIGNLEAERLFQNFMENQKDKVDFTYELYTKIGIGVTNGEDQKKYVVIIFLTDPIDLNAYAQDVFELVNQERVNNGVAPLVFDEGAAKAATIRASEVGRLPKHVRPGGAKWNSIFMQTGIEVKVAGENIARGQKDPQAVMKDWMASPGHRKNILRPEFERIGIAVFPTTDASLSWVQLFVTR